MQTAVDRTQELSSACVPSAQVHNDERLRSYLHDVLVASGDVSALVAGWDGATARRIVDLVMRDYVGELDRALTSEDGHLFGQDAHAFMRQYDELWRMKLSL